MPKAKLNNPTVDLSHFSHGGDDQRKKVVGMVRNALSDSGFFQIVNHGVPLNLMNRCLDLSKEFFDYPTEEKLKLRPLEGSESPLPVGYVLYPDTSPDKNEFLWLFAPSAGSDVADFNIYPSEPPEYRRTLEDISSQLARTASVVVDILNDCMGLPEGFLKEYNSYRSTDFIAAFRYFPATAHENNGISEHQDGNCMTFVFQDEVGGLEVLQDGQWIEVTPQEGTIVVNIGDVVRVWTNDKFKSPMHRVVRKEGKSRYSFGFFYSLDRNKWVEPLPQFTEEIGELPKYRGFYYRDYQKLRMRNKSNPPPKPEDTVHISYYAIQD